MITNEILDIAYRAFLSADITYRSAVRAALEAVADELARAERERVLTEVWQALDDEMGNEPELSHRDIRHVLARLRSGK